MEHTVPAVDTARLPSPSLLTDDENSKDKGSAKTDGRGDVEIDGVLASELVDEEEDESLLAEALLVTDVSPTLTNISDLPGETQTHTHTHTLTQSYTQTGRHTQIGRQTIAPSFTCHSHFLHPPLPPSLSYFLLFFLSLSLSSSPSLPDDVPPPLNISVSAPSTYNVDLVFLFIIQGERVKNGWT
jgi:hypothetical protein